MYLRKSTKRFALELFGYITALLTVGGALVSVALFFFHPILRDLKNGEPEGWITLTGNVIAVVGILALIVLLLEILYSSTLLT